MLRLSKPNPKHWEITKSNLNPIQPGQDIPHELNDEKTEVSTNQPLNYRSAGTDIIQLSHPAERENYTSRPERSIGVNPPTVSAEIADSGKEDKAAHEIIRITDINRALGETPQNIAAAKYFASQKFDEDKIKPHHILQKSFTSNRNHFARQSANNVHVQTVPTTDSMWAKYVDNNNNSNDEKKDDVLSQADELIDELNKSLATSSSTPARRNTSFQTPQSTRSNASIATTQLAPTVANINSPAPIHRVLTYVELKNEAESNGFNRSSHYPGRQGAIPREIYEQYLQSIGVQQAGSGIARVRNDPNRRINIAFGILMLDKKKLNQNVLSLNYAKTNRKITGLPNQHISPAFKNVLISLLNGYESDISSLTQPEKVLIRAVLKKAQLIPPQQTGRGLKSDICSDDGLLRRLWIGLGSLQSGNTSSALKNQIAQMLDALVKKGQISTQEAANISENFLFGA